MNEFITFFTRNEVTNAGIVFLMLASCFVAIFHTIILSVLFRLTFKSWLFFAINPLLILLTGILNRNLVFLVFFILFISVFILGFTGMVFAGITKCREEKNEREQLRKRYKITPTPLWKKIVGGVVMVLFLVSFYHFGFFSVVLLFLVVPFISSILPSNKSKFLKYQRTLPTSKIRSVAMGLAEIEGVLEIIEPMLSPITKKKCIGYRYRIEKISTDKNGDKSYTTIFDEVKCNSFYVSDETGKIRVDPDKIEFIYVPEDEFYSTGGKRYTQFLLREQEKMLLIGKAGLGESNRPVFEYEAIKKVFGIAPSDKITHYNTFKPLLNSFLIFSGAFAVMVSFILLTPIHTKEGQLIIGTPNFEINLNSMEDQQESSKEEKMDMQRNEEAEETTFQPQTAKQPRIQDSIN